MNAKITLFDLSPRSLGRILKNVSNYSEEGGITGVTKCLQEEFSARVVFDDSLEYGMVKGLEFDNEADYTMFLLKFDRPVRRK